MNVFSTQVVLGIDCRMLSGHDESEVEAEVRAALAGVDAEWELEWISVVRGNSSRCPSPLSDAIVTVLRRHVRSAEVGFTHNTGFTDSHWFRGAFPEVVAYGFTPFVEESYLDVWPRVHGVDERILVGDLAFQAFFVERVALELLGGSS